MSLFQDTEADGGGAAPAVPRVNATALPFRERESRTRKVDHERSTAEQNEEGTVLRRSLPGGTMPSPLPSLPGECWYFSQEAAYSHRVVTVELAVVSF